MNIFIATPCYDYKVNSFYVESLLNFQKEGINFEVFFKSDSLITRVRNELITEFYNKKEQFTHILWLDSDVAIPAYGLKSLLKRNVDIVSTPIPIKNKKNKNLQSIRRTYEEINPYFFKCEAAATGCLLMSKDSVIRLIENSEFYFSDSKNTQKTFNVFKTRIRDNQLMSEDWDLCYTLRDIGYEIYVDSSFPVCHFGTYNYSRDKVSSDFSLDSKINYD